MVEKKQKLLSKSKINIACIGNQFFHNTPVDVINKFADISNVHFHVIGYRVARLYEREPNFSCYPLLNTIEMYKLLSKCQYVLNMDTKDGEYIDYKMSGAYNLAFSTGCQLIIPHNWNLNLKSPLYYDANPITLSDTTLFIHDTLPNVYNEIYNLEYRCIRIFDKHLV